MTIEERKGQRKLLEVKLLSSILSRGSNAFSVLEKINFTAECLEDVECRALFQEMKKYYDNGEQIAINALPNPNFVTVVKKLEIEKEAVKPLAKSIWDMKVGKEIENLFLSSSRFLHTDNTKAFAMLKDFLEEFEGAMFPSDKIFTSKEIDEEAKAYQNSTSSIGIEPPLKGMNEMLGNGELILVCARPSIGKTAMMTSIISELARGKDPKKQLVFSLEQSRLSIYNRVLSNLTNISASIIKKRKMSEGQKIAYYKYSGALRKKNSLYICDADSSHASLEYIRAVAKAKHKEGKVDIIYIDYAQLMISRKKFGGRQEELSYISRELKGLARNLGVPIILLAQINRGGVGFDKKKGQSTLPKIDDIKGTGSFEQDADQIYLLHRERDEDSVLLMHEKNRDGRIGGRIRVSYDTHIQKIGGKLL